MSYKLAPSERGGKENQNDTNAEVVKYKLPVIFFQIFLLFMNNWDKDLPNLQFILYDYELIKYTEFASWLFALDLQLTENLPFSVLDVTVHVLFILTNFYLLTCCEHL